MNQIKRLITAARNTVKEKHSEKLLQNYRYNTVQRTHEDKSDEQVQNDMTKPRSKHTENYIY